MLIYSSISEYYTLLINVLTRSFKWHQAAPTSPSQTYRTVRGAVAQLEAMNFSRSRRRESDLPYYSGSKSRSIGSPPFHNMTRFARPMAMCLLLLCILFIVWDAPPLLSARATLCAGTSSPASKYASSDLLFDRFAESASEKLRRPAWTELSTLVMVAGHAVFTGKSWDKQSLQNEDNWILEPYQRGQVSTFLKHIQHGVEIAANDSSALLLFSGGQTRDGAGPRSEGMTYWLVADAENWYGKGTVRDRALAEEYARDSIENLLFSICRFNQVVGRYPHTIKVISFGFKEVRFVDIHRKALRFPRHRFEFYGIDPDGTDAMRVLSARERAQAIRPFVGDPYGCNTAVLSDKKETRNPYMRFHPYPQGCPELTELFSFCGRSIYHGPLPWDPHVNSSEEDRERRPV